MFEPYPVPPSYRYASIISPVTIGVKTKLPPSWDPYETFTSTVIGGYWKIWVPIPAVEKSTTLDLTRSVFIVPPIPTSIRLNLSSSIFWIEYLFEMFKPPTDVPSVLYSTISPVSKPWFLNSTVLYSVEIPVGFTLNFLWVYPEPDWRTLTSLKFFLERVLNLWIPLEVVAVENPIALVPAAASSSFLNNLIDLVFTNPATYSSPLTKVPVIVCVESPKSPIDIGSWPFWL